MNAGCLVLVLVSPGTPWCRSLCAVVTNVHTHAPGIDVLPCVWMVGEQVLERASVVLSGGYSKRQFHCRRADGGGLRQRELLDLWLDRHFHVLELGTLRFVVECATSVSQCSDVGPVLAVDIA